jgi:hypothetical protein
MPLLQRAKLDRFARIGSTGARGARGVHVSIIPNR